MADVGGGGPLEGRPALLPDPAPRRIRVPIISVDDHLIEPPDLFEGRVPRRLADGAPRIMEEPDGTQAWLYEGRRYPNVGLNAVIGRPKDQWSMDPARFEEMRPGCYDIHARIADMDLNGVWASLCFPSLVAGFCGSVFSGPTIPSSAWPASGRGTSGISTCGPGRPRTDHPSAAAVAG